MPEPLAPDWKRTWIDIDLDALIANYRTACALTAESGARVTCVVKSNAYGHGAVRVAQALQEAGCESFAVSCAREAIELRRHGVKGEILVMGLAEAPLLPELLRLGVALTASDVPGLAEIDRAARETDTRACVHLKINTGFHRLGFDCTEEAAENIAQAARQLTNTRLEGLFSHLGLICRERDVQQHDALMRMQAWLARRGVNPPDVHLCDSIGLVRYPQWHHSRVRVGALLFGVRPAGSGHMPFEDRETLAFRTTVAQVRQVKAGEVIGYGDDMILDYDATIATLCAGYGDGYPRHLSNGRGRVSIRGRLAQVVGLVCMDQMMVDVTDIPGVAPGDTADLLGGAIPYGDFADRAETNRNECITILSRRPVRVYWQGGRVVTVLDSLLDERRDFT